MVEDFWNVDDLSGLFRGPQDQVVAQAIVEFFAETADALDQRTLQNTEITDVVVALERVRGPVRFE